MGLGVMLGTHAGATQETLRLSGWSFSRRGTKQKEMKIPALPPLRPSVFLHLQGSKGRKAVTLLQFPQAGEDDSQDLKDSSLYPLTHPHLRFWAQGNRKGPRRVNPVLLQESRDTERWGSLSLSLNVLPTQKTPSVWIAWRPGHESVHSGPRTEQALSWSFAGHSATSSWILWPHLPGRTAHRPFPSGFLPTVLPAFQEQRASLLWHLKLAHSRATDRLPCSPELTRQA